MKRTLILFILLILILSMTGCGGTAEKSEVDAVVTKLQYNPPKQYTSIEYNFVLKMPMVTSHTKPAEYLITISYEDTSITYDNEKLFETAKEGDTITMILVKKYDKNNKLVSKSLRYPNS